jgi:phosphate uptake regulator
MKRKLVKQGNGALTLSLPYDWLKNNNLEKGDYIDLEVSGKDIVLSGGKEKINEAYVIEITKEKPFFKRYLKSCYILGRDKVILRSFEKLPIQKIITSLLDLIGYEIEEQTATRCVISPLTTDKELNLDSWINRVFFIISSMLDDIINALNECKVDDLKEISLTEQTINKDVNFCLRILNKRGYIEFKKTPYIYQIIVGLEQIGDALRDFCICEGSFTQEISLFLSDIKEYYSEIFYLFSKYSMKKISKIKEKRLFLYQKAIFMIKNNPIAVLHLYRVIEILHQLEVALDPLHQ